MNNNNIKGKILIYTNVDCVSCVKAKQKLVELNLPYDEINLESFPTLREELKRRTGRNKVPQIFFNEISIGGYEDLMHLIGNKDEFASLLYMLKTKEPPPDAPKRPDPKLSDEADDEDPIPEAVDEMIALVDEIKTSGIINKRKLVLLKTFKRSFYGNDLLDWLMSKKDLDKETALNVGQKLIDRHLMHDINHHIDETFWSNRYYVLLEDEYHDALNSIVLSTNVPLTVGQFGEILQNCMFNLHKVRRTESGEIISYRKLSITNEFKKYLMLIPIMQRLNMTNSSINDRLAFFVNIYNGLMLHATIAYGPPTNVWQRHKFFNNCRYVIGGYAYSLQDIENGILRSNRKLCGSLCKQFPKYDGRIKVALHRPEALIHFALNCGTKSCPPLKIYSSKEIKSELKIAAEEFLNNDDGVQINVDKNEIQLSEIFKWFREDFGHNDKEMLLFVYRYVGEGVKRNHLKTVLETATFTITYSHYDWSNVQK